MARVSEVAELIYEIKPEGVEHEIFPLCTVYLVVGEKIAMVEVGSSVQISDILHAVKLLGRDANEITFIIPTHVHADHAGGAGHLARQLPRARVVAHSRAARLLANQSMIDRMLQSRKTVFGDDADKRFGGMLAVNEEQFVRVEDGTSIDLNGRQLIAIHTPGHDPYHLCLQDSKTQGVFCGDALGGYFTATNSRMPACVPGSNPEIMIQSIEKVQQLNPAYLFFSHGGTLAEPSEIIETILAAERLCIDTALKAMRAGEDQQKIVRRLAEILAQTSDLTADDILAFRHFTTLTIEGYRQYFEKEGMLS